MHPGEQWRCMNKECGCEVMIVKPARRADDFRPICGCGHPMKKPYTSPHLEPILESDKVRILHDEVFLGRR